MRSEQRSYDGFSFLFCTAAYRCFQIMFPYLLKGAELDPAGTGERDDDGVSSVAPGIAYLFEFPLFNTLLALLINLEKPWGLSPGGPDPLGAEELIVVRILIDRVFDGYDPHQKGRRC